MLVGENINSFISIKRLDSNFNRFFEVVIILTITKLQHFEKNQNHTGSHTENFETFPILKVV